MRPRKIKKGFTLIELLVVVAIIAVLVAILLPALSSARAMGVQIQCSANLKTSFTAAQFYANEYNGAFPIYFYSISPWDEQSWGSILAKYKYLTDTDMVAFRCPSVAVPPYLVTNWAIYKQYFMYGANLCSNDNIILNTGDSGLSSPYNYYNGINFNKLNTPANYILMADSIVWPPNYWCYGWQLYGLSRNHQTGEAVIHLRHRNLANISFADGHAEGLNESAVKNAYYRNQEGETRYFPEYPDLEVADSNIALKTLK